MVGDPLAWHDTHGMPTRSATTVEVRRVVVVSYRLGGGDGVSTEAAKWICSLKQLGCSVYTLAGEGEADILEPGLAVGAAVTGRPAPPPDERAISRALASAELVVVENLCSLPFNPAAGAAVARALAGRPAVLRHHDLAWQRPALADWGPPPDDPAWSHVVVNDYSRRELAERGVQAVTIRNAFDPRPAAGDRDKTRTALGVPPEQLLVVQPTRAIARKNIPRALALAESLGAFYWLVGAAEEGYGEQVRALLRQARVPVHWGPLPGLVTAHEGIEHAYAAADLVALPSHYEGFGNPAVEAALQGRLAAVGHYPAAQELRGLGFRWLDPDRPSQVAEYFTGLSGPGAVQPAPGAGAEMVRDNARVARRHLNLDDLPGRLVGLMAGLGLRPPRPAPRSAGEAGGAGQRRGGSAQVGE